MKKKSHIPTWIDVGTGSNGGLFENLFVRADDIPFIQLQPALKKKYLISPFLNL